MSVHVFVVAAGGARLDQVLAASVPGLSRRRARLLIERGSVSVDGRCVRNMGRGLRPGATISVEDDDLPPPLTTGQNAAVPLLFESPDVLVANKPAGVATEPTRQSNESLTTSLRPRYGAVHAVNRLDVDTSGVVVVARHAAAAAAWGEVFASGAVDRGYIGVVDGVVKDDAGLIDAALLRPDRTGRARVVGADDPAGKASQTRYRVLGRSSSTTVLALQPLTGRTHQLRVHLAHLGHPLVGDRRYGTPTTTSHLGLHAASLRTRVGGVAYDFQAPLPDALGALIVAVDAALLHECARAFTTSIP